MDMDYYSIKSLVEKLDDVSSVDCTNEVLGLIVSASETIKKFVHFYIYWTELYGKGLEVANWHLNGDTESFDNFYESAVECMKD